MRLQKIVSVAVVAVLICGFGTLQPAQAQTLAIEKTWGGTNDDESHGVAVDSKGNIYVTGHTKSFGVGEDVFLLKYNPAGTLLWQKTWGGTNVDEGSGVAVDSSGNIYVTGTTWSFGVLGDVTGNVFLLKYDSAGTLLWQKTWGGTHRDWGNSVAVDSSGKIYVTGSTDSFVPYSDVFLLKYEPVSGTLLWQRTWGGTGVEIGWNVAFDSSGNIYVTGYTNSFGVGGDVLLLKYNPAGILLWQKTWGGTDIDSGLSVAFDSSGNIYVTGYTNSFGSGGQDVLLLKYNPAGILLWQKTWGGTNDDFGTGRVGAGKIYVTGNTANPSRTLLDVSGTETAPAGTETTPTGTETTPTGTETTPTGTETTPTGTENYAGGWDAFLLVLTDAIEQTEDIKSIVCDPSKIPLSDFDGGTNKVKDNRRTALLNMLDAVIIDIEAAMSSTDPAIQKVAYQSAIDQLNSILDKTDGCSERGTPDTKASGYTPDWITTCASQAKIDPLIRTLITTLQILLAKIP